MPPIGHIIILCFVTAVKCKQTSEKSNSWCTNGLSEYHACKTTLNLTSCFPNNISQPQLSQIQTLNDIVYKLQNMSQEYSIKYNGPYVFFLTPDSNFPREELSSCYNQFLSNLSALSNEMKANCVRNNPCYASTDDSYRQKWKYIHKINFQYVNQTLAEIRTLRTKTFSNSTDLQIFHLEILHSYLEAYKQYLLLNEQLYDVETFQLITVNYVDPVIFVVIVLVGIGGNVSLLIIFIRNRHMRTASNVMFINLTIADLLYLVVHLIIYKMGFMLPLLTKKFSNNHQIYAYYFFILFTTGLAVYSVVVISVQRYCALHTCKSIQKYSISFLLVGSVWVMAALLAIPDTELMLERGMKKILTLSFGNHNFQFIAYGVVPSFTMAVFYCAAARKVPQDFPGRCTAKEKIKRSRARSVRILHFLIALFIVTYIPSQLFILVLPTLNPINQTVKNVTIIYISKCLMFLNSSCNPIMLYLGSEKFRRCLKEDILWFRKQGCHCYRTDLPSSESPPKQSLGEEELVI